MSISGLLRVGSASATMSRPTRSWRESRRTFKPIQTVLEIRYSVYAVAKKWDSFSMIVRRVSGAVSRMVQAQNPVPLNTLDGQALADERVPER